MTIQLKRYVVPFAATTLAGVCLHFLYAFWPNGFTACFSPVRESIWEHVKLLYWPYLIAAGILLRKETRKGKWGPWLLSLLLLSGLLLLAGGVAHLGFGSMKMIWDGGFYVVLLAVGFFFLPQALQKWKWATEWTDVFAIITVALGVAILLFSFLPPALRLFADLSGLRTFTTIPH